MMVDTCPESSLFVGAGKHTNGVAEVQASLFASLWALQSGLSNFRYCYDAMYAESVAGALACPRVNTSITAVTVALRRLLCERARRDESIHTPAHSGDPWDECVDRVADAVSRRHLGFACPSLPSWFLDLASGKAGNIAWLHVHAMSSEKLRAYPCILPDGRLDWWHSHAMVR